MDFQHNVFQATLFYQLQQSSTTMKIAMCNKPLNWLTFLLKLNTSDTYQSVDKVGKVAETLVLLYLPSSVIL